MNATEHIVETYFRLCRGCLTRSDIKVVNGNNRQLDLLAANLTTRQQYHIEVGVSHQLHWTPRIQDLYSSFDKKFLGKPPRREGARTDFAKGKSYFTHILKTYEEAGLRPDKVQRVWVCWLVANPDEQVQLLTAYSQKHEIEKTIQVISFRDCVLPQLIEVVASSNYDDEVLRTLSLLKQRDRQTTA